MTYVPSRRSVERLSRIVVSLTVSSEEKDFVLHIFRRLAIQSLDFFVESLPLRLSECLALAGVGAVNQAKVFLILDAIQLES
jgi:hypothetical protein